MQKNNTALTTELEPIVSQALTLTINSSEDMQKATSLLSQLNKLNDRITELKDEVLKPLLEATKAERARWKPSELKNEQAIAYIRSEMTSYQTALLKAKRLKEEAITKKLSDNKITLDKAITSLEKLPALANTTSTDDGAVSFRNKQTLKVTDITKIPHLYFDLNETRLLDALKTGILIPGAEIEIVLIPYNLR